VKNVLVAKTGALSGNVYTIAGRTLIGRDAECDIQLLDASVSRRHACVLEQDDGSVLIRDLKSHSGIWVRGQRLTEALLLQGDEIVVGDTRLELRNVIGDSEAEKNEVTLCCDSPLAQVARKGAWSFCPACGASTAI
jgi:pSer/pThr/pTyr-binding forkhead associated (FHA) protein